MPRPKGLPRTGGRKKGTPNKLTQSVIDRLGELKCDPIEGMAKIAADESAPIEIRARMFAELAQYVAPKRKAVEHDVTANAAGPRLIIVTAGKGADDVINDGSGAPTVILPDNGRRRMPGADQPRPPRPVKAPAAEAQPARPPPPRAQTVRIYDPYGDRGTRVIPAAEFDPARHELADGPSAFAVNMPGL